MAKTLYRFRSAAATLHNFHELELQHIHLARPETLNDPMEGYQDVFWRGDLILWTNLLKHYVLCLVWATAQCQLMKEEEFTEPVIFGSLTVDDLPTDDFRIMYREVLSIFFSEDSIIRMLKILCAYPAPLRRDQLGFHLYGIHNYALLATTTVFKSHNLMNNGKSTIPPLVNIPLDGLEEIIQAASGDSKFRELMWEMAADATNIMRLTMIYNNM